MNAHVLFRLHPRKVHSRIDACQLPPEQALISNDSLQHPCPALGNLYLSSCPGKKVRLTGPVRGRGAICRDLKQDLRRIKALGVGCIVCCLDDEELEILGASWPDYSQAAQELGLDILRVPIPEGLAPASLSLFDAHLTRLISVYTLAGIHVLAHCRGGVGRAGLVACCWMLKLGLCGWASAGDNTEPMDEGRVRRDTLEQVERAIGIVRRRRSLKAIETYEQVKFLVGYVDYLRGNR
ncbi:protein-tyrosine phosphatase-like protein [Russula vinacea]|nr:protein-tyrosine phosphatase-like protein [Russula vinacea]